MEEQVNKTDQELEHCLVSDHDTIRGVWRDFHKVVALWERLVTISEEDWPLTHDTIEMFITNLNKVLEPKLNQNWRPE